MIDVIMKIMACCLMGITLGVLILFIGVMVVCAIKERRDKKHEG